ncbi:MAG TPA: HNH endonuclease [Chitinophagales bacterium]|nr:HNH endonuclease [Chitinophagales bacterium]
MRKCIFCDEENEAKAREHIVSESLGNKRYIIEKSAVCDKCNAKFSKFEQVALGNSIFVMSRAIQGIASKKGKTAKGRVGDLEIQGDDKFTKKHVVIKGLDKVPLQNFDPITRIGDLTIKTFDKSESAAAKLLLKTGIAGLYKSHPKVFNSYDFSQAKDFLSGKNNKDWPIITSDFEIGTFRSVPQLEDKYSLSHIDCKLTFLELDLDTLLFKFKYGGIPMMLNLVDRDIWWIRDVIANDPKAVIYPEHYRKKVTT